MQPERLGDLRLALRLEVFGTRGRDQPGLGQTLILEIGSLAHQLGARRRQLLLGLKRLDLDVRIGELEQWGVRLHMLPRLSEHPIDATGGERRDEADVLRHERAGPPHLAHHLAAAHRVHEERCSLHARRRGLQAREKNRQQDDRAGTDAGLYVATGLGQGCAGDVHELLTKHTSYHEADVPNILPANGLQPALAGSGKLETCGYGMARPTSGHSAGLGTRKSRKHSRLPDPESRVPNSPTPPAPDTARMPDPT